MIESCRIVYQGGSGELVEKKSRFITDIRLVSNGEKALALIEEVRKKYWGARHHCFAYTIGDRGRTTRCSDDGESSQIAGKPVMDVLAGEGSHDVHAVVTRYFGGTLLDMDGLVRACSGAVKVGLEDRVIVKKKLAVRLEVTTDYNGFGKIQYTTAQVGISTLDVQYADKVVFVFLAPISEEGRFRSQIMEGTNERTHIKKVDEVYYDMEQGELIAS